MDFQGANAGVVVITGGGSGIGQACALAFCRAGCAKFALLDLNSVGLEDTKAQLEAISSVDVLLVPADVTQEANVVQSIKTIVERFGRIDYVVQSAGLNQRPRALLHETEMANYDRVVNINLRGLYMVQREVVRAMREQTSGPHGQKGSIVNIASISGIQPTPNLVPYAASKAGVIALTKGDAQAYIKEGIRLNCVCPGVVLTAMNKSSIEAGEDFSIMLSGTPAARAAQPEELAWSVLFLSHPNSSYIVGHALVQDGGTTLT